MSMQARVEALKQQLENLFPGKWFSEQKRNRNINTGLVEIDNGITRGIARKKITEWNGPVSSGKTTLLRNAIINWCAQGLNVAYIDCEGKLYPADWSGIGSTASIGKENLSFVDVNFQKGKFWIVRPSEEEAAPTDVIPLVSKKNVLVQEAIWSADQFIRSNAFDIVILDLGQNDLSKRNKLGMGYLSVPSRIYARFQRALDKSKAAFIVVADTESVIVDEQDAEVNQKQSQNNWGCHARFLFNRGLAVRCESSLKGVAMITPTVKLSAWRDGQSQEVEVNLGSAVPNRLFTHSAVPDRRTSKG